MAVQCEMIVSSGGPISTFSNHQDASCAAFDALQKRIWFLWFQGIDNAPDVVQMCHRSWRVRNPNWELVSLSATNLPRYLSRNDIDIPMKQQQALSDLIRIHLLQKYGGVWVDASCFCVKPLDDWLGHYLSGGFFAFANPGRDRLLSSWFLASDREHYIPSRWAVASTAYWSGPRAPTRMVGHRASALATRLLPDIWFRAPVKALGVYPYYWFHYLFRYLYDVDLTFKARWDATPRFSADTVHAAQRHGLTKPPQSWLRREIDQKLVPLYKLNWRVDDRNVGAYSVLHYLYESL